MRNVNCRVIQLLCLILIGNIGLAFCAAPPTFNNVDTNIFDMEGQRIIQDEANLGIINGKLTTSIPYRDVAGIAGLWSPPYVSSNFVLDGRIAGQKIPTAKWTWRPYLVVRMGKLGDVSVVSTTALVNVQRAVVIRLEIENAGDSPVPFEFSTLAWLDSVRDWNFARPDSHTETKPEINQQVLSLRQGPLTIAVGVDSDDFAWEVAGNLGHAAASLPAKQTRCIDVVIAIGPHEEATASVKKILGNVQRSLAEANSAYARQIDKIFAKLPAFHSDNVRLERWYNRSLVHLLTNRWDLPDFKLNPYYSTGSINGGCVANYLWNFGEPWKIFPLYDAQAARAHIKHFLSLDLTQHFNFLPISGEASGPWYMINQEKIIGLTYYYVLLTGDVSFLEDKVNGKSIRDHMVLHAMFGDDATKPISLIDYGPSGSHLELRRGFAYNHISPDLNARRYANYLRAATLCDLAGKPANYLRERAELLKPLIEEQLWDPQARWFSFKNPQGKRDLRYTVQMFKPLGSGVFDKECEKGLLSHLNDHEFLSDYGLHSLSKLDPAFDQLDIDNGGGGICTSFPPQIIERLYQVGQPQLAADLMRRLLWWGDTMPYWGDSLTANCIDYRRDTPLQCTFDGTAAAQCLIFGTFGVNVRPNGDIVVRPRQLPFAAKMTLDGLKIRGRSFRIEIDGSKYEIRTREQSFRSATGNATVFSAANSTFAAEN